MVPSPSCSGVQLLLFVAVTSFLHNAYAYTWSFQQPPTQCGNLAVSLSGSDGVPPYRLLVVPFGPNPYQNVEPRPILDIPFPDGQNQVQFQLSYPVSSQFVAVVSDATAFGSGGTSVATTVMSSNVVSCLNSSTPIGDDFFFNTDPENQLVQCQPTRIWYDVTTTVGPTNFLGIIPGGQSFIIPQAVVTSTPTEGQGFTWTPSLRGGTTFLIVGGDSRGNGSAGMTQYIVSYGTTNIVSCLSDSSPSSTLGSPAGGYPTSTANVQVSNSLTPTPTATGAPQAQNGSGTIKMGILVGCIVAGAAFIILSIIFICYVRRRRDRHPRPRNRRTIDRPFTLEDTAVGHLARDMRAAELPMFYDSHSQSRRLPGAAQSGLQPNTESNGGRLFNSASIPASGTRSSLNISNDYVGESTVSSNEAQPDTRILNYVRHDDLASRDVFLYSMGAEIIEQPPAYRRTGVGIAGAHLINTSGK